MTPDDVQRLLSALVATGALAADTARALYTAWTEGAITDDDLPAAPDEMALAALLFSSLALGGEALRRIARAVRSRYGDRPAVELLPGRPAVDFLPPITPRGALPARDLLAEDLLRIAEREVRRRTAVLFAPPDENAPDRRSRGSVARWQTGLRQAAIEDVATMARLGAGRPLTDAETAALARAADRQARYVDRFAVDLTRMRAGMARPLTELQVGALVIRKTVGGARAAYWRAFATATPDGAVLYFEGNDVGGQPCTPCLNAERAGPYLPDDPALPVPAEVCKGGGFCRHRLRAEYDPAAVRRLRNAGRSEGRPSPARLAA